MGYFSELVVFFLWKARRIHGISIHRISLIFTSLASSVLVFPGKTLRIQNITPNQLANDFISAIFWFAWAVSKIFFRGLRL